MRSFFVLLTMTAVAVAPSVALGAPPHGSAANNAAAALDRTIAAIARRDDTVPGVVAAVSAPRFGIEWQNATGLLQRGGNDPLRATDAFRLASITKVFVSATILRLIEQKKFGLYDGIDGLISDRTRQALTDGGYDVPALTVFHLMTHTSGIYDISSSPEYLAASAADIQRRWTRDEQIAFAAKVGKPTSKPGEEYHYSDTSYVILGEIIERASGKSMGDAMSSLLGFQRLGMKSTYIEDVQPTPRGERRAHQYYGDQDYTDADPSFDLFGGGGLVSTVGDQIRFIRALMQGSLFTGKSTMAMALMIPQVKNDRQAHAPLLGLTTFGKRKCWSHAGFWGEYLLYCPDNDLAVALSWGQARPNDRTLWQTATASMADAIEEIVDVRTVQGEPGTAATRNR